MRLGAETWRFMGTSAAGREMSKSDFFVDLIFATSFWMRVWETASAASSLASECVPGDGGCAQREAEEDRARLHGEAGAECMLCKHAYCTRCVVWVMVRGAEATSADMSVGNVASVRGVAAESPEVRMVSPALPYTDDSSKGSSVMLM